MINYTQFLHFLPRTRTSLVSWKTRRIKFQGRIARFQYIYLPLPQKRIRIHEHKDANNAGERLKTTLLFQKLNKYSLTWTKARFSRRKKWRISGRRALVKLDFRADKPSNFLWSVYPLPTLLFILLFLFFFPPPSMFLYHPASERIAAIASADRKKAAI